MGLTSWIKDIYYNHLLENADSAYQLGNISKAEEIYLKILRKQQNAAEHLAKMYFELATSKENKLQYLSKLKSLLSKATLGKDRASNYLESLILHIENVADEHFTKGNYNKASKYLKSIELDKTGDSQFAKKSRLYALYVNLNIVEFESSYAAYTAALGLIASYCKKHVDKAIEDAIICTSKRLRKSKKLDRAYCTSNCLAKKGNEKAIKECIATAYEIYKSGSTSEKSVIIEDELIKYITQNSQANYLDSIGLFIPFSKKYREKYVSTGTYIISAEADKNAAFSFFIKIWKNAPDVSLIKAFAKPSSHIASLVFDYFIHNSEQLTENAAFLNALTHLLTLFKDYDFVLNTLEKFKSKGFDTKEPYIAKAKSAFYHLDEKHRLFLINKVILNYPDDTWAINEKISFGESYQAKKDFDIAILLYKEVIGLHANAEPRLALLYYEQYQKESNFSKKKELLKQALAFKKRHNKLFNSIEYDKLFPNLSKSVIDLIKDCFVKNNPDGAYNTALTFRPYSPECFDKYIHELKEYNDVAYVLPKLETLKNEGIDIESDYRDFVIRITSSTKYEEKYKLKILSKAIDLFSCEKFSEQFILTAINVIKQESEVEIIVSTFGEIWKRLPDARLLTTFVNQEYNQYKPIIDYLVDKTRISGWKQDLMSTFCNQILDFDDYQYSLTVFKRLTAKRINVQKQYVATALKALPSLNLHDRLSLINETLDKFSNEYLINEKLDLSDNFKLDGNIRQALRILNELIGLHADAEPRLALLYYEQYQKESNFSKKKELLKQALAFKKRHNKLFNSIEYDKLFPNLSKSVIDLIKDCFVKNNPDGAYNTALTFRPYSPECFDKYIHELKEYNDVAYVLPKLETLKNEGIDIESDYRDFVIRITSSTKYEEKYKLKILSKAIDLFSCEKFSEQFILTAINVIKQESEVEIIVSTFGEIWKRLPDARLLTTFVNQEYNQYKPIIDYLVDKTRISGWKQDLMSTFCNQILDFDDYQYSLTVFKRLAAKRINVQKQYVATVLKALPSLNLHDRLSLINETLDMFSNEDIINEKLNLGTSFATEGNFEIAERILTELMGLHEMVEPRLAKLYYEESKKSKDLDRKQELIKRGLQFHFSHSRLFKFKEYNPTFKKLLLEFTSLIDKYYINHDYNTAYKLCIELKQYSDKWQTKYINLRANIASKIESSEKKISFIKETFDTLESEGFSLTENNSAEINSLWDILSESQISEAESHPYEEHIQRLNDYSHYISNHCFKDKANILLKEINNNLISTHKQEGYKYEQEGLYSEAISCYTSLSTISDIRTGLWCKIRITICEIKKGKYVSKDDIRKHLAYIGFAKEKKDLAYRYSLFLIKNRGAKDCSTFVTEFLPNEEELLAACNNAYIKEAESLLNEINGFLEKLNRRTVTLNEARAFAEKLKDYDEQISPYLINAHEQIIALQPSIQSYILSKCYEEEEYEKALKLLKETGKNWYDDDIYFRNVAIACLGIAETGKINRVNYKAIISCWLTAVYRDRLFVQSLDYTSWDDPYTFTLINSLGASKNNSFTSLPYNVNFDYPVDRSVIAIADVQQSLLNRFEIALDGKDEIFREFYDEQKNAMDSLANLNMDSPCIIAAPYIVKHTAKCYNEIKKTLDYEYRNYGEEKILKIGCLYGINSGTYKEYKDASDNVEVCISAARSEILSRVKNAFTSSTIKSIQEFPELCRTLTTEIQNTLADRTRDTTSHKTILNVYSIICPALDDCSLSYIFGKYINQCVVEKLNNNSLDLASGLIDLVSAYKIVKSYSGLKNNIGNVLEALIYQYITEANPKDISTIKSVLNSTGSEFECNVANALSDKAVQIAISYNNPETIDELSTIHTTSKTLQNKLSNIKEKKNKYLIDKEMYQVLEKIKNKTLSFSSALQKVYKLYTENKDNSGICECLCTLTDICIKEYIIPDKSEKTKVILIFEELKNNKSTTYRREAQILKNKRNEILESLPWEARNLLTGGSAYGSELNENGRRLKNALQYYLILA